MEVLQTETGQGDHIMCDRAAAVNTDGHAKWQIGNS